MDYLTELRRELDAFGATLDGNLHAPVDRCGNWTLLDRPTRSIPSPGPATAKRDRGRWPDHWCRETVVA